MHILLTEIILKAFMLPVLIRDTSRASWAAGDVSFERHFARLHSRRLYMVMLMLLCRRRERMKGIGMRRLAPAHSNVDRVPHFIAFLTRTKYLVGLPWILAQHRGRMKGKSPGDRFQWNGMERGGRMGTEWRLRYFIKRQLYTSVFLR